jgi:diguanylate cyclase (GGDEF)-like protein
MERPITRALPRSADLMPGQRRSLAAAFLALPILLALTSILAVTGSVRSTATDAALSATYILVVAIAAFRPARIAHKRRSFSLLVGGIGLYGLGNIVWFGWIGHLAHPPVPSLCDVLWIAFYPLAGLGLLALAGLRARNRPPVTVWLDGTVAGGGLAAIGAAIVFPPVLATAHGSILAVATKLAYPMGDLLLVGLVVGIVAMRGWRMDRGWLSLGLGFLLLAAADFLMAARVAHGGWPSALTDVLYAAALAPLAFACWQVPPSRPDPKFASWSVLLLPVGSMFAALGLMLYDHAHRLNLVSFGLAALTLVAAIARVAIAFRDVRGLTEARRLAGTDDLTSLPNRRQFMGRTDDAIEAIRTSGGSLAVLMLDLDNFKQLNDTLGHHAGDVLLRMIGPRLEQALRGKHIVARLGGDEFAILVHPAPDETAVIGIAQRILGILREPFDVHGLALRVTGSLGIAQFPDNARDADELMRHADIAMYQAKTGRNGYDFYARERDTHSRERLALAAELATALERRGIEVHYQPKADAATRRIVGVEALVRWRRADGTLAPPAEFVSAAEHAGLSRALTGEVLDQALGEIRDLRDAGHDLHVAVNTTVADLLDGAFPDQVERALAKHGLPADALVLEITESSVLADPDRIGNILDRLRRLGIELSLDDFGTGYSSLAHLKSLPVAELKIDRSFVARMCTDATDSAIVFAMIQLGRKLGIRVVAEGVEDRWTWDALRELDCDLIQGFLLSRPVAGDKLRSQLDAQARARQNDAGGGPRRDAQRGDLLNAQRARVLA